jgi:hypothetical protein
MNAYRWANEAAAALVLAAAGCATVTPRTSEERRDFAEAVTANWAGYARTLAEDLMTKYGPPNQIDHDRLVWNNNGPWERTVVWDGTSYYDSQLGSDILEQTVFYPVPAGKRPDLAQFSKSLRISENGTRMTVLSLSEESSFLTLNLAHEIIADLRSPTAARELYARTLQLAAAGKSSPYTQGLLFSPKAQFSLPWPVQLRGTPDEHSMSPLWGR